MERVVYILGAGFSAPLGLPVIANFLERAKDLRFGERGQDFEHFDGPLEQFRRMGAALPYFRLDLFDIEELLSILEMQRLVAPTGVDIKRLVIDVIREYTLPLRPLEQPLERQWLKQLFSPEPYDLYGSFAAALLKLRTVHTETRTKERNPDTVSVAGSRHGGGTAEYSVVSLNYDLVLETCAARLSQAFGDNALVFRRATPAPASGPHGETHLAKLHGSIDTGDVIPPTWNKVLHDDAVAEWSLAFRVLSEANHIRFLGYSLPLTDAYIRYLLKCAVIENRHLKSLDVLCLDSRQDVRARYRELVTFPGARFMSAGVEAYLETICARPSAPGGDFEVVTDFDQHVEREHEGFFGGTGTRLHD